MKLSSPPYRVRRGALSYEQLLPFIFRPWNSFGRFCLTGKSAKAVVALTSARAVAVVVVVVVVVAAEKPDENENDNPAAAIAITKVKSTHKDTLLINNVFWIAPKCRLPSVGLFIVHIMTVEQFGYRISNLFNCQYTTNISDILCNNILMLKWKVR